MMPFLLFLTHGTLRDSRYWGGFFIEYDNRCPLTFTEGRP
jgi:hypothetical protein